MAAINVLSVVRPIKQWMLDNRVDPRDERWQRIVHIELAARELERMTASPVEKVRTTSAAWI